MNSQCQCKRPDLRDVGVSISVGGKWYIRKVCRTCHRPAIVFIRKVDQGNVRDLEAADRSQAMVGL